MFIHRHCWTCVCPQSVFRECLWFGDTIIGTESYFSSISMQLPFPSVCFNVNLWPLTLGTQVSMKSFPWNTKWIVRKQISPSNCFTSFLVMIQPWSLCPFIIYLNFAVSQYKEELKISYLISFSLFSESYIRRSLKTEADFRISNYKLLKPCNPIALCISLHLKFTGHWAHISVSGFWIFDIYLNSYFCFVTLVAKGFDLIQNCNGILSLS